MSGESFDRFSRLLGKATTRRQVVRTLAGVLATGAGGALLLHRDPARAATCARGDREVTIEDRTLCCPPNTPPADERSCPPLETAPTPRPTERPTERPTASPAAVVTRTPVPSATPRPAGAVDDSAVVCPAGQTFSFFLGVCCPENYTDFTQCCQPCGTSCIPNPEAPAAQCVGGIVCPYAQACAGTCCPTGTICHDGCCPNAQVCGGACCAAGVACINDVCCPNAQVCSGACCAIGSICGEGVQSSAPTCCPTSMVSIGPNGPVCCNSDYPCPIPNGQCQGTNIFEPNCAPLIPPTDCCPACIAVYLACNGVCAAAAAGSDDPALFEECNEACSFAYKGCQQDCSLVQQTCSNWSPSGSTQTAPVVARVAVGRPGNSMFGALIDRLRR